jgi:formylglycine-generating enzyme required for sulfatase activity
VTDATSDPTRWTARQGQDAANGLPPGHVLSNRYRIESELGAGGMGIVCVALDKVGAERVAIKLLRPQYRGQPEVVAALREEVIKTRRLRHDNIVGVYAIEQDGDDLYIVMEFLQGATVQSLLDDDYSRGMPFPQASEILHDAAAALSFAHTKGIIHSDIKPSNIFVMPGGRAKLLDFGIARALRVGASRFDTRRLHALTPTYASIEMMEGGEPTEADDVFSLACVAYELLTGRHPFERRASLDARAAGLLPAPIPVLSESQNAALRRGLAFTRAERYVAIDQFVHDLVSRAAPARRAKVAPLVIGSLAAIGVVLAGGYAWHLHRPAHGPGDTFRDCAHDCPSMTVLPAGRFQMDSLLADGELSGGRSVSFAVPFALSSYPVTRAQFRAFAQATGHRPSATCVDSSNVSGVRPVDFFDPGFQQSDDDPVVCVTMDDARAYADWINRTTHLTGYHLPTEAEWEYAARAGARTAYPWGATEGNACSYGNFGDRSFIRRISNPPIEAARCDDGFQFTSPVHAFSANAWGLHDMLGNVREWTEACSHPGNTSIDGGSWLDNCRRYSVVRGAGFATFLGGPHLQVTKRSVPPSNIEATNEWGFRIARSLP